MTTEGDPNKRAQRERNRKQDTGSKAKATGDEGEFQNYKPPYRLLALELTIIILLIILLLIKPSGFSAISQSGNDRVGLLSSCSGSSCTSWLGAPAGGKSTPAASATKRQLGTAAEVPAAADDSGSTSTSSSSSSSSSPTSFHLRTGLAGFCSLVLVCYAFIIHLIRLREKPPPAGSESAIDLEKRKKSRFRRYCIPFANFDFNGVKRGGYRISRLFTGVNVLLLLCVCIAAGVQASSAGFAPGFVLLVFSWIMLFLVALMEFLDERRRVSQWLMVYRGRLRCGGHSQQKKAVVDDDDESMVSGRETEQIKARRKG